MHGQYNATKYQEKPVQQPPGRRTTNRRATGHYTWGGASCVFPKRKNFYSLSTSMRIASCSFKWTQEHVSVHCWSFPYSRLCTTQYMRIICIIKLWQQSEHLYIYITYKPRRTCKSLLPLTIFRHVAAILRGMVGQKVLVRKQSGLGISVLTCRKKKDGKKRRGVYHLFYILHLGRDSK